MRVAQLVVCGLAVLTAFTSSAIACRGAHARVFPTCTLYQPRPGERVSVVYAYSGSGLSSVSVGGDEVVTEVVDVQIGPAEKPHYIVLSSGKPVIWRFSGDTET